MFKLKKGAKVYLRRKPTDLRKGLNGLYAIILNEFKADAWEGHLFVFLNRNRKLCKVLYFDGTGFCIWTKRLAKYQFACLWSDMKGKKIQLSRIQFQMFLQGFTLQRIFLQKKSS